MQEPVIPATTTENLFVSVPHRTLFLTDTFTITIGSYTRYEPIAVFEMSISYQTDLLDFVTEYALPGWQCSCCNDTDPGGTTTRNYVCNYPDTDGLDQGRVNKYTDLVKVEFRLYSDETLSYLEFTTLGEDLRFKQLLTYTAYHLARRST